MPKPVSERLVGHQDSCRISKHPPKDDLLISIKEEGSFPRQLSQTAAYAAPGPAPPPPGTLPLGAPLWKAWEVRHKGARLSFWPVFKGGVIQRKWPDESESQGILQDTRPDS